MALLLVAGLVAAACSEVSAGHGPAETSSAVPAAGSAARGISGSGWRVIRGAPVRSVIVINAQDGETFAPPPAWAKPKLNGVQAWDESFLGGDRNKPRPIAADLSYQLGLLTVPPSVTDVLAWGYSSPPGPCPLLEVLPYLGRSRSAAPTPSPQGLCIEWTFIDARNASNPAGTWQRLGTPPPSPSPTPSTVIALHSGGFVGTSLERFSPRRLVVQGPHSVIRWTFDNATCSVDLSWFMPPQSQRGPGRPACLWQRAFSVNVVTDFASRGHVFSVIGGYVAHWNGQLVRAVLADGRTWIYDPEDGNGSWLFAVQRCGNFRGTAFRAVEEIDRAFQVIARLPVPAAPHPYGAGSCRS